MGVHLVGLWFDKWVPFGPAELLIPFRASYKPLAVAWGIVAFYLLVAVELTSLFMRHIPRRWWHRIHLSSLLLLVLATVHSFTAGTDRSNALARWIALVMSAALIFVATFRVVVDRRAQRADRSANLAAARAAARSGSSAPAPDGERSGADRPRDQGGEPGARLGVAGAPPPPTTRKWWWPCPSAPTGSPTDRPSHCD